MNSSFINVLSFAIRKKQDEQHEYYIDRDYEEHIRIREVVKACGLDTNVRYDGADGGKLRHQRDDTEQVCLRVVDGEFGQDGASVSFNPETSFKPFYSVYVVHAWFKNDNISVKRRTCRQ